MARRDELTGVKNKKAYKELEESVQTNIDNGMDYLPVFWTKHDAMLSSMRIAPAMG